MPRSPTHQEDVGDSRGADQLGALETLRAPVQVVEETFAAPEEDGHDREVQFVHEAGAAT